MLLILSTTFAQRIKFATVAPKGSTWYNVMDEFAEAVEKSTNGDVKIKIYAGGSQGDEVTALKRLRAGQIHAGGFIGPGLGQIVPSVRILDLPFMFKNYQEVDYVLEKMFPYFQERFNEKGFHLLAWAEAGLVNVYSSVKIESYDDLKSAKVFSLSGDPVADITFDALNITPQKIPLTDVLTSLETGDINTTYTPPLGALSLQWFRKQQYFVDVNLAYASGAVIIRNDIWNNLSESHKKIITDLAATYFEKFKQEGRKANAESLDVMRKEGLIELTIKDMAPFIKAGVDARRKAVGELFDQKLLDQVVNLIKEMPKK